MRALTRRILLVLCLAATWLPAVDGAGAASSTPPSAQRQALVSFDGTRLSYVVYVPGGVSPSAPAAAVLAGHDGGGPKDTDPPDPAALNPSLQGLLAAGFIVVTWAARGYAPSEGPGHLNSPEVEVRDVQRLIDELAKRDDIVRDRPGDPRLGMTGESYGGWIQLLTAAVDPRIDALSPRITLYNPVQDLQPNGVLRSGWTATLDAVLTVTADFHDELHDLLRDGLRDGKLTDAGRAYLTARSVKDRLDRVAAPTLLVQSFSDTFTTANNAVEIYRRLGDRGVPTKLYLFCGGHTQALLVDNEIGVSCNPNMAEGRTTEVVVNWMDSHLRRGGRRLGPPIQWELQDGSLHGAAHLPSADSNDALRASVTGKLVRAGDPYMGPAVLATPSPDGHRTLVTDAEGTVVLGVPRVKMTVTRLDFATTAASDVYVFSKLVDEDPNGALLVVDEQATPMSFSLTPGSSATASFDLAAVAWEVKEGHKLWCEVSATSPDFAAARHASTSQVVATVRVPVVTQPPPG